MIAYEVWLKTKTRIADVTLKSMSRFHFLLNTFTAHTVSSSVNSCARVFIFGIDPFHLSQYFISSHVRVVLTGLN